MKIRKILCISAFLASASMAMAQFTPVTSVGILQQWTGTGTQTNYWLQSITAGGDTYFTNGLAYGTTTAAGPTLWSNPGSIDDWNLATGSSGNPGLPSTTVLFGGANWTDSNGSKLDFFLFEASGAANPDDIQIAAIFPDNSLGQTIVAPTIVSPTGWGNTGILMNSLFQSGQALTGLAWSITDLKDAGGINLTTASVIKGIAFVAPGSNGIDPTGFYAVVPVPEPSTVTLALLGLGGLALLRKRF